MDLQGVATSPVPWHARSAIEVAQELGSDPSTGLTAAEAARRLAADGSNALETKPPVPWWRLLLSQFTDGLILVLIGAAILSFAIGEIEEAVFIVALLIFNGALGFWQERQAQQSLNAIQSLVVPETRVRRDGEPARIPAIELVPGDVVLLEAGDTVPADGRLLVTARFSVAEAALTGEAVPVDKDTTAVAESALLGDRTDMVYAQTAVTTGRAELVVTSTGMDTEIGKLAALMADVEPEPTPLQRQTARLGHRLALIAGAAVLLLISIGLVRGESLSDLIVGGIALAVAAIPEALPATVTVTLAIGMSRLAKRHAVVKRLHAVETLGSTSVICSDKTGTLTLNQMTVRSVWVSGHDLAVDGHGYDSAGRITSPDVSGPVPDTRTLAAALALCNDAAIRDGACIGDPTEGALVVLATKSHLDVDGLRRSQPRLSEIPFDSVTKRMATFHPDPVSGESAVVCVKGAVESVLACCGTSWVDGKTTALDDEAQRQVLDAAERLATRGMRVLAAAQATLPRSELDGDLDERLHDLTFLGLVGIVDPPRAEARDAITAAHRSGITVKMITGDHPATAHAIAGDLGIEGEVVRGADVEEMDDSALAARVREIGVFARVAPEHKLRIVRALQSHDLVVSMTGDGVNDAPALEQADIGVAMGVTGTEVTKEAADMILLDDNFSTIVAAVGEGRTIYENIVKFVRFQLSTNLSAIMTVLVTALFSLTAPFTTIQILWINIICDGPPALALGVDPARQGAMDEPPRARSSEILPGSRLRVLLWLAAVMGLCTIGVVLWAEDQYGAAVAATMGWTTFVFAQLFNVFNARAERASAFGATLFTNRFLWLSVAGVALAQIAIVKVDWLRDFFEASYLDANQLLICAALGSVVLWIEELRKVFLRRRAATSHEATTLVRAA